MPTMQVDESNFDDTLDEEFEKGQIVILKFETELCDACMALGFELEDIEEDYENVSILEIDCAESTLLAERFNIIQVPVMIILKDRYTTLYSAEGVILAQDIEKIIES